MRFAEPWAFLALLLVPLAFVAHALYERRLAMRLRSAGDAKLIRSMTTHHRDGGKGRRFAQTVVYAAALLLVTTALARPQFGLRTEVHKGRGMDLVLALDLSRSMEARDVVPSRLERARVELSALIDMLPGDRIGLVGFTSVAIPLCPLTVDHSALKLQLGAASPADMPRGGTSLAHAIEAGQRMIDTSPNDGGGKAILILTDGEEHVGNAPDRAKAALDAGIEVHLAGVGSRTGEPIPLLDGSGNITGYVKDKKGQTVITRLNEAMLRNVAASGGGLTALPGGTGGLDLTSIRDHLAKLKKAELEERTVRVYEERYRWALIPAFVLLLLASFLSPIGRRLALRGASMIFIAVLSMGAGPFEREDGDVADGNTALTEGRAEDAITSYDKAASRLGDEPVVAYNRGLANAAAGELDAAIEDLNRAANATGDGALRSQASFAAGNAYRSLKKFDEAIGAYRQSLIANPRNTGARRNLELTRAMKRIQALQPKQENPDGEPSDDDQNNDEDAGPSDGPRGDGGQGKRSEDQQSDGDGGVQEAGSQSEDDEQGEPDAGAPPDSGSTGNAGEDGGGAPDTGAGSSGSSEDSAEDEEKKEMNAQDVQQLLDALQEREQVLKRKRLREKYGASPVEKDW